MVIRAAFFPFCLWAYYLLVDITRGGASRWENAG